MSLLSPSRSTRRCHRPLRRRRRLDSRPLRGHSGWDGGLCACKHRMPKTTAMATAIRCPLQLSRNVDEGPPTSTAMTPATACYGQPAAGQSWQPLTLERLGMLDLIPGSRSRRSSSEERLLQRCVHTLMTTGNPAVPGGGQQARWYDIDAAPCSISALTGGSRADLQGHGSHFGGTSVRCDTTLPVR